MEENSFFISLVAKLEKALSVRQLNRDIKEIQKQLARLELGATLDPKVMDQLARSGQQAGKRMGEGIDRGLSSNLYHIRQTIANIIKEFDSKKLSSIDLSKMFNLNRADIDSSVTKQVHELTKEINALSMEVLKTGSDDSWGNITSKLNELRSVLLQFGQTRDLSSFRESIDILERFQGKKIFAGNKSEVLANTGMSVRELNNQFKNLGVTFTTVSNKAVKLDTVWDELLNISPGLEKFTTFGDQINAVVEHLRIAKEAMYGNGGLQPVNRNEVSSVLSGYVASLENAAKKLTVLGQEQQELNQRITETSATAANKVIRNENRKQQAYKQTADAQKQIAKDESLIKSGANIVTFENTVNAAREASQYFRKLLKDETELIAVSERFGKANELTSFAVNVKRASGEVETLRYALENIGSVSDPFYAFKHIGAELNNSGAVRQMQQMEKYITDYQTKLDNLKTKYSKTSLDYSGFEKVFNDFKQGIGTVNDLKLAFN